MTDYKLINAIQDFERLNNIKLNLNKFNYKYNTNIDTGLNYYIIKNNKIISLFKDQNDMETCKDQLIEKNESIQYGYAKDGIKLKINKYRYNKYVNKIVNSIWYYTDMIYDIGCFPDDEEIVNDNKYYKNIEFNSMKLVEMANVSVVSSGDTRDSMSDSASYSSDTTDDTDTGRAQPRDATVWSVGDKDQYDKFESNLRYEFEIEIMGDKYWIMSLKSMILNDNYLNHCNYIDIV